jgi:hypothetical protein
LAVASTSLRAGKMKTALEIIKLLVVFLIPKFASEVPQECANFGIGTLKRFPIERTQDACHSLSSVIAGLDPRLSGLVLVDTAHGVDSSVF